MILALTAIVLIRPSKASPAEQLDGFLADWSRGADATAARATDAPVNAAAALRANRAGLDGAR